MSTTESSPEETSPAALAQEEKPKNGECSSTRIFLRPSPLAAQTEKLKFTKPEEQQKSPKSQKPLQENQMQKPPTDLFSAASSSSAAANRLLPDPGSTKTIQANQMQKPLPDLFAAASSSVAVDRLLPDSVENKTLQANPMLQKPITNLFSAASSPAVLVADSGNVKTQEAGNGFVFGCNLHDRALNYEQPQNEPPKLAAEMTDNLTFENAGDLKDDKSGAKNEEKTLSDFAKEYEMKRPKVKFEEVDVITGEEGESNVLQMNCKLFAFDKTKRNWHEKGRGFLRLNDREDGGVLHSRLIMRVQGSLKVVLNTKVWSAMKLERAGQKTLQFSAVDSDGEIKVHLIISNSNDVEQLYNALDCRIANLKHLENVSSVKTAVTSSTPSEKSESMSVPALDTSSNDSFESSPRKRFKAMHPEDGSADSSTENITTEGTYDASSENSTDSTDGVKPYDAETTKPQETA